MLLIPFQNHQNQLDIFDGNVAHISTWLSQTEVLLDENEKKPASKQEEIVKVTKEEQAYFWGWKVCCSLSLVDCAKLPVHTFSRSSGFILGGGPEVLNESEYMNSSDAS